MYSFSTLTVFGTLVAAALATTGPCIMEDYTCNPVMDASGCYNAIILGWDGASKDPADIFKCVDPPELRRAWRASAFGDNMGEWHDKTPPIEDIVAVAPGCARATAAPTV
ncbi:hypothetical protein O1611_g1119 [Lasiodiplodia mahajangana]|uniref:Uncharacterized protein n=1 Tax=Lasiodiplodia mahajangana TaxID=1108764 RepID=A0ACC2JYF1_9PEZI|nr:hypothetical protein O1611_g1119 [Lasiodiplodia mahajangana]